MTKKTCWRINESGEEGNYQRYTTDFMLNYFAAYHYPFIKIVFDEVRRKNALLKLTTNQLKQVTFPRSRISCAKSFRRNVQRPAEA